MLCLLALILAWAEAPSVMAREQVSVIEPLALGAADEQVPASGTIVPDIVPEDQIADPSPAEKASVEPVRSVPAPRDLVRERWQRAQPTPHARAGALLRTRLELGLGDLTIPALVLMRESSGAEDPSVHAGLARQLAPGVPAIQIAAAKAYWSAGEVGWATQAAIDALLATTRNLSVKVWLLENLSLLLLTVVLFASLTFIVLAALAVFSHAAHDLGDILSLRTPGFARVAALAACLLVPLVLGEGVLGLALGLFALGFAYGKASQRSMLLLAAVMLVIGIHPLAQLVATTTTIVDQDPLVESTVAVLRGVESRADIERLEAAEGEDLLAIHALAYHDRRHGLPEDSRDRLDSILARAPTDAVALANRGTDEMRRGRTKRAIGDYERAAALLDSPVLLFDLSQGYARAFRMDEYERTLSRAQALDDEQVAALSRFDDADLVAELELPEALLVDRFRTLALGQDPDRLIAEALAPGHLGESWPVTVGGFVLVALVGLLFARRFDHASLCVRCGHRICTRCEGTVWSEEICEDCHHLFQNPEATDPLLRMARLQTLAERDARRGRIVFIASLLVPGVAGLAARRPDYALFGLLLFGWSLGWILWPSGVLVDPHQMGDAAWLCFAVPGLFSVLGYGTIVLGSLAARKKL